MHYDPLNENISIVKVSVYLKPLFIDDVFLLHLINLQCIHCVYGVLVETLLRIHCTEIQRCDFSMIGS